MIITLYLQRKTVANNKIILYTTRAMTNSDKKEDQMAQIQNVKKVIPINNTFSITNKHSVYNRLKLFIYYDYI